MSQPEQKTNAEKHVEELQRQAHKEQGKTKRLDRKIEDAQKKNERPHGG